MSRLALFAYGSLVSPASAEITLGHPLAPPARCRLRGWRRTWTTARQNLEVEKTFARAGDGSLPPWCLGLNLEPGGDEGPAPNGALIAVSEDDLERLDLRELRYRRFEVTGDVRPAAEGRHPFDTVFAYRARPEHHHPTPPPGAILIASYLRAVEAAFAELGPGELELFRTTTGPPPVEVVEAKLVHDRIPAGNPRDW